MQTSDTGVAFIEDEEGMVLKAYRGLDGVWTIGPGLTAASGVVVPRAGMVITRDEALALTHAALSRNYEPAVSAAMPGASQTAFDGGASFHWNTGAIGRASWVARWQAHDLPGMKTALLFWNKVKGTAVPGLTNRRLREYALIANGDYGPRIAAATAAAPDLARVVIQLAGTDIAKLRAGLKTLGYDPGPDIRGIAATALRAFQRDHDLTVDGVLGKATKTTIERMLAARGSARTAGVATVAAGAAANQVVSLPPATSPAPVTPLPPAATPGAQVALSPDAGTAPFIDPATAHLIAAGLLGLAVIWVALRAWHYRDAIAARVQSQLPRLAAWLRSI